MFLREIHTIRNSSKYLKQLSPSGRLCLHFSPFLCISLYFKFCVTNVCYFEKQLRSGLEMRQESSAEFCESGQGCYSLSPHTFEYEEKSGLCEFGQSRHFAINTSTSTLKFWLSLRLIQKKIPLGMKVETKQSC